MLSPWAQFPPEHEPHEYDTMMTQRELSLMDRGQRGDAGASEGDQRNLHSTQYNNKHRNMHTSIPGACNICPYFTVVSTTHVLDNGPTGIDDNSTTFFYGGIPVN